MKRDLSFKELLAAVARRFVFVFLSGLIVAGPGIANAPDLDKAILLGTVAVISAASAAFKAVQELWPTASVGYLLGLPQPYAAWVDAFTQAVAGTMVATIPTILDHFVSTGVPDFSGWDSLVTAALIGALTAGFRAVEALLTPGETVTRRPTTATAER